MKGNQIHDPRLRRDVLEVSTFAGADVADREYWHRQTPAARLRAMELMRRINYGQAAAGRMKRALEVLLPPKRRPIHLAE